MIKLNIIIYLGTRICTMGHHNTKQKKALNGHFNGNFHRNRYKVSFDLQAPEPVVSLEQEKLLKQCWALIQKDIAKVGIITFLK